MVSSSSALHALQSALAEATTTEAKDWYLSYKARYGMTLVLGALENEDGMGRVATLPFSCVTVLDAVLSAKLLPQYVDIAASNLCMSPDALELGSDCKAVILQHSFGIIDEAADRAIAAKAHAAGALLMEDDAHCVGRLARDGEGRPLSDIVIFSFGIMKMLPTYFGGAVWVNPEMQDKQLDQRIRQALATQTTLSASAALTSSLYKNEMRVFNHLPKTASKNLRSALEAVGLFEPAVTQAELEGRLPLEPMLPNDRIAKHMMAALRQLPHIEDVRARACKVALRGLQGAPAIEYPSFLEQAVAENQPLLRFPLLMPTSEMADTLIRELSADGIFADAWYRPLIFPGPELPEELDIHEKDAIDVSRAVSERIVCLPTDISEVAMASAIARARGMAG